MPRRKRKSSARALVLPILPGAEHRPVPARRHAAVRRPRPVARARSRSRWAASEPWWCSPSAIPEIERPGADDLYTIGTEAVVGRMLKMPDGSTSALVQGQRRVRVVGFEADEPYLRLSVVPIEEAPSEGEEADALIRAVLGMYEKVVKLSRSIPDDHYVAAINIDQAGWLADFVVSDLELSVADRQEILETLDPLERLHKASMFLARELDVLELQNKIHSQVQTEVDKNQREYFLREQLKAIQKELGEADAQGREILKLREKLDAAGLPEEVRVKADEELERLAVMPTMSPEVGMVRSYLEWLAALPWIERDRGSARHRPGGEGAGPAPLRPPADQGAHPGVHGGPQAGGGQDAQPGHLLRRAAGGRQDQPRQGDCPGDRPQVRAGLAWAASATRPRSAATAGPTSGRCRAGCSRRCGSGGTINPVFMLDEIDKLGSDFRGDPSAALLEVLDPEQNVAFSDHYLDVPYNLSKVMFVTTANILDPVPPALRDRMEVIELPGLRRGREVRDRPPLPGAAPDQRARPDAARSSGSPRRRSARSSASTPTRPASETWNGRSARSAARSPGRSRPATRRRTTVSQRNLADLLGPPRVHPQPGRGARRDRHRDGRVLDAGRRRRDDRRGLAAGGQGPARHDRPAWRRDEGVGPGGAELRAGPRGRPGAGAALLRDDGRPHPRAGGRDPEGRPVGGHHDGDGAGLWADAPAVAPRGRDDRRDHAARPGAAGRRDPREGRGGAPSRASRRSCCRART